MVGIDKSLFVDDLSISRVGANVLTSGATFSEPGTYVLRLTAGDGQSAAGDAVTVTVR